MTQIKSAYGETAHLLANNVTASQDRMLAEMKKTGSAKNEGLIEEVKLEYQKDQRSLALFSELMKNMHDMLMSLIRSLKLN